MKEKITQFWIQLAKAKKILLINHVRMDPDAFSSLVSLYFILKKDWYEVKAVNDDNPPDDYMFLVKENIFEVDLNIKDYSPDLIISLDAASLDQLWSTYTDNKIIFENTYFIIIDHHLSNPWFWDLNIINTKSSSTCELVFNIIEQLWLTDKVDKNIATILLTWIYTDTNIYYNSNTSPETLEIWAKLMRLWADFRLPMFEFYKKKKFNKSKLWWEALWKLEKTDDWKIFWAIITEEMFKKTWTSESDVSWLINEFLSNLEWMEICFILYPIKDWKIKASLRSSEKYDISKICTEFWWWWHKQAGGFSLVWDIYEIKEELLNKIQKNNQD